MPATTTQSDRYPYQLMKKQIDLSVDSVKVLLMRDGFIFDKAKHRMLKNIKSSMGPATTIAFVDGGGGNDSITDSGNGFVNAGFVSGNKITISGSASNNITIIAISVTAGTIEVATGTLTTEEAGASVTLTSDDELATGNGYTQNTKTTGTITVTEDNTNHRTDATFPTVEWTASGGSIGPTPGPLLFDDSTTEDTIIQMTTFADKETITDGNKLQLTDGIIRGINN